MFLIFIFFLGSRSSDLNGSDFNQFLGVFSIFLNSVVKVLQSFIQPVLENL